MNKIKKLVQITAPRNPNLALFLNGQEVDWQ